MNTPLRSKLFSQSPTDGFDASGFPLDLQGWGSEHPIFRKVLAEAKPRLVIEVGSWKGASAIHMARCLQDLGLNAQILCIDTWLGAIEFWGDKQDPERYLSLGLKNGYPTIYYQFLANVVKTGFQDVIVPFPQSSAIAARWLRQNGFQAEAIYVDASHEEEDVFQDLCGYWQVLAPGGIMFGDDYDRYWPSVRSAVQRFSQFIALTHSNEDGKWTFRKPLDMQTNAFVGDEACSMHHANTIRFEVISEQLTTLVHLLQNHQHEVQTAQQELLAKEQQIQAKEQQIQSLQSEVRQKQTELDRCGRWLADLQQSHTWRWFARYTVGKNPLPLDVRPDRK